MVKYYTIRVSKSVKERLLNDKKHFEETIGINYNYNTTILEYQKILDGLKE